MKLISFDIKSDFGFFRKPESNNTINVSYNIIHRPAVLGILGAIIGLDGYQEKGKFPEYYQKLNHLKIGIKPLNHEQGNYSKTLIKYSNTIGYANKGATFLTSELTLIKPEFRIFILLDEESLDELKLIDSLKNNQTEFIPYFGKNEFTAWFGNYKEYKYSLTQSNSSFSGKIETIFIRNQIIKDNIEEASTGSFDMFDFDELDESLFVYFERLPVDFDKELIQYELKEMVFTNYKVKNVEKMKNVFHLL